jgi:uncharacterized membrane protein YgdD (TMEM256/DUF423 family)
MNRAARIRWVIVMKLLMLGIVLGAFGAHALADVLTPKQLASFETAVRYQLVVTLGAAVLLLAGKQLGVNLHLAFGFVVIGIVCFSGSIYGLTLLAEGASFRKALAPVTPLGGTLMIVGYAVAAVKLWRA